MLRFEEYLQEFNSTINYGEFIINMIILSVLTGLLGWFYMRYGKAISNRQRFGFNFIPLALTTMLIITIVKSSLALSLGLVGALSIVRYRAAIKDPEELTYLFIAIGLGLAAGANQIIIGIIGFTFIMLILFIRNYLSGRGPFKSTEQMYLNIHTSSKELKAISDLLAAQFNRVELKRMDENEDGMDLSYIIDATSLEQIEAVKNELRVLAPGSTISFVEQKTIMM